MSSPVEIRLSDTPDTTPVTDENPFPVKVIGDMPAPSGSLTADIFTASMGLPSDAAWDGVANDASVIALLKRIALNTDTA